MDETGLTKQRTLPELAHFFTRILGPERKFYTLAVIYGIGISLLSLGTPISVQMLVNSIINTGLAAPLVILSLTLFLLLCAAGLLNALRLHLVDVFGRRFYARMVSEISLRAVYALNPFFDDSGKGPLFNRYFDIIIVMKRIPYLLVGGFSILLQAAVGFALTSAYHPLFLAFNIIMIVLIWLIWLIWGRKAIKSAMDMSHKKHAAAAWLEGLASSNGYFKTRRHIDEALRRTDEVTANYIEKHKLHFSHYFSQAVAFFLLYALAGSSLLGLGGWLVINDQLSIGQLVAAELVLSAVFYGLSQLGTYMAYFYDLCAAVEELSFFYDIEQESPDGDDEHIDGSDLVMANARGKTRGIDTVFSFDLPAEALVYARAPSHGVQRLFSHFMKRHAVPDNGYITVAGTDINAIKAHSLRHEVMVLDRPNANEMSIREYLRLSADNVTSKEILDAIEMVGLEPIISQLDNGLDSRTAHSGWPLSFGEVMQLKLAAALIAKPRILLMSQVCDILPEPLLQRCLKELRDSHRTTVIYFSNRKPHSGYTHFLYMGRSQQQVFTDAAAFERHYEERAAARGLLIAADSTEARDDA